jgi:ParB family transcriptional regulator, chromosome partitioning protein
MMSANKKNALGRGLSALLSDSGTDITTSPGSEIPQAVVGSISNIPIDQIEANPFQPRTEFENEPLLELSESIKEHGVIQPVTVRKLGYDKYQLISGERRFRASKLAGLTHVPAYVRIANDQAMLEMAIVENVQRENLNAIEIALSFQRLLEECDLTQEALSKKVSKQRSTIANYLRLLKLPAVIQAGIRDNKISMGHARAIVNMADEEKQIALFYAITEENLSVRDVEERAREEKGSKDKGFKKVIVKDAPVPLSFEHQKVCNDLTLLFNSKVNLNVSNNGKGKLVIEFNSGEDLQRIIEILDV